MTFDEIALTRTEQAERLTLPFGEFTVRIAGEQTGGTLSVVDTVLPAGALGAAPHVHHGHEEYFLVTAGEVAFDVPGGVELVGAGGSVAVPRGRAHGFRNASAAEASLTMMFTPAGYEGYFRDVAEAHAAGEPVTPALLNELRGRYRTVSVDL
ncbi:cupin domain-containing protein [Nocardioides speluncae]|uniref:cupin domain-containing protein n=1 Tax=Nocardioides speluncae TaxID=2670337 RepID=UPI000D691743|nr:cupin domain-containing protein [Nocardioides speluncae]